MLAWRLRRQSLEPASGTTVTDVAERVVALRGWPADSAECAIAIRRSEPALGALDRALATGAVIRSYAFRGGSYVFTPEIAAALLGVRRITRIWETARWQQQGRFALDDWQPLREAVCEALETGPMTREEIAAHLGETPNLKHLADAAGGAGSDSLYKPLHWWGDICFGPSREGKTTFRKLSGDPRWPGIADVDDAGRRAVLLYLGSYGPATEKNLHYWLTEGLGVPRRRLLGWVADLGEQVSEVSVGGTPAYARNEDLEELSEAEPSDVVRLLPAFDPWVMGPGTADTHIIAAARRALASRGANLVIRGGVVAGTWRAQSREVTVSWFNEAGPPPEAALGVEVRRLADIQDRELELTVTTA